MHPVTGEEHMIGKDLDFDLHNANAIQELIAEGLLGGELRSASRGSNCHPRRV
jgi:hypothetical protein